MAKKNIVKIEANELSKEAKVSMKTRIVSGIIGICVAFPLIFLGDYFIIALLAFALIVGVIEILKSAKKKYSIWLYIVSCGFAFVITFWPIIRSLFDSIVYTAGITDSGVKIADWRIFHAFQTFNAESPLAGLSIPITAIIVGALLLFLFVVLDPGFEVRDACFTFTMILLISLGVQSVVYLRLIPVSEYHVLYEAPYFNLFDNLQSCLLFIYAIIGTFVTDIGAYFIGVFFGKHKMNPRISPKKTWEGFIGGNVISFAVSFLFAFLFAINGMPIGPNLTAENWYIILIISLIMPLLSVLGDFIFSSIKRHNGIKDFGNILPGHGGVLDRIDSLITTCLVVALIVSLVVYWG